MKALARAFRYQRLLDEIWYASISEMAVAERIGRYYLGRLLRLTPLAPDVVEGILGGRQPAELEFRGFFQSFQRSVYAARAIRAWLSLGPLQPRLTTKGAPSPAART